MIPEMLILIGKFVKNIFVPTTEYYFHILLNTGGNQDSNSQDCSAVSRSPSKQSSSRTLGDLWLLPFFLKTFVIIFFFFHINALSMQQKCTNCIGSTGQAVLLMKSINSEKKGS